MWPEVLFRGKGVVVSGQWSGTPGDKEKAKEILSVGLGAWLQAGHGDNVLTTATFRVAGTPSTCSIVTWSGGGVSGGPLWGITSNSTGMAESGAEYECPPGIRFWICSALHWPFTASTGTVRISKLFLGS